MSGHLGYLMFTSLAWNPKVSTGGPQACSLEGCCWRLFWFDCWLTIDPLISQATRPIATHYQLHLVKHYWTPSRGWHMEELQSYLLTEVLSHLSNIQVNNFELEADITLWLLASNGRFSTHSLRQFLELEAGMRKATIWSHIWKFIGPLRPSSTL